MTPIKNREPGGSCPRRSRSYPERLRLSRAFHIVRLFRIRKLRSGCSGFAEQSAQVREHVVVETDFAGVGGGYDHQHFKQQHLRVRAYRSAEEERRVHHQAHQGGEGGEGAEDQPQADQELAVRNKDVEEAYVRQGEMFQESGPPALDGGMIARAVRDRAGEEARGVEAAGNFVIPGFNPLVPEVNPDDGQQPHGDFIGSQEVVKHIYHSLSWFARLVLFFKDDHL